MLQTIRFCLRSLRRSPKFTVLAVLILTLGIGATTAMFTVVRTVLLKPLAYREPERLVTILFRIPQFAKQISTIPANAQHYQLWRNQAQTIEEVGLIGPASRILSGHGESIQVGGAEVTSNIFNLLGVRPALGRSFAADEKLPGRNQVIVLSHSFWQDKLGGQTGILGQQIRLNGRPFQVIGVMPAAFPFPRGRELSDIGPLPERVEYWVPLVFSKDDLQSPLGSFNFIAVARMKAGIRVPQMMAEMTVLENVIAKTFPEPVEVDPVVRPLQQMMAREIRLPLLLIMAAVTTVLLIVCINLMNLMTVRAAAQSRDRAIRVAIGAVGRDLVKPALLESLALALMGGALGTVLAGWLLTLVRVNSPVGLPRVDEIALDPAALGFSLFLSIGTALLFGVLPALRAAKVDLQEVLQSSGRSATEGQKGQRAGKLLVAAEVALSTILLLSAGLLVRSFVATMSVDPGLDVRRLLTAKVNLPPESYGKIPRIQSFYRRLQEGVGALPGVRSAGLISDLPLTGESNQNPATAGDRPVPPLVQWQLTNTRWASMSYFGTVGIPMKAGHVFEQRDSEVPQAVISENLAARLWPGENAVGRPLKLYGRDKPYRITGVVGTVHAGLLTALPAMIVYFPDWQEANREMSLAVRTENKPDSIAGAVRELVHRLEPQAAILNMETMEEVEAASVAPQRFQMILLLIFAAVALTLACLGIYAVLAFATGRRTTEIGIRMAMGASPDSILLMTLRTGLGPVLFGVVIGLLVSAGLTRVIQQLLFGVQALDPLIYVRYVSAAVSLILAAALACFIPARRAARMNPVDALRHT